MKVLKRLCTFIVAVGIALTPVAPVQALENVTDADAAKQGVVQVNTVIVDDNSEKRLVIGGTGFIIGDAEGTEYVITSKHIVTPDQEVLGAACEYYGLISNEGNDSVSVNLATEVVIESDVVLNASILTSSSELDMVVLQLPQPIYTRTPLKLLTNRKYDVTNLPYAIGDAVYALGYPDVVTFESDTKYYSDQDVQTAFGEITDLTTFEGAAQSACWFWETNNINKWADAGDIKEMTRRINGGYIGLDDRIKHYQHALHVLGGH